MKKRVLAIAALVACTFGFVACDGGTDLDIIGHINLYASNPVAGTIGSSQVYSNDSINFKSAMCNVNIDSAWIDVEEVGVEGHYDIHAGTVMVGTTQTLISNDIANITYPLCGINVRDTVPGTYDISCPIENFSFFEYLDTTNVSGLITTGLTFGEEIGNLFAVAVAEDAFYIGYSGTVTITNYGAEYMRVEGSVNNVNAIYVTVAQIEAIANMSEAERAEIGDLTSYFPHITFNGNFSSMRANIEVVMQALNAE